MTSLLSLLCELTQPLTNKQKKENNQTPTILRGTGRTKNNISSQESGSKMEPFLYSPLYPFKFSEKICEGLYEV